MNKRRLYPARKAGEQFQRVELLRQLDLDEEVLEMLEEDVVVAARRRSIDRSGHRDGRRDQRNARPPRPRALVPGLHADDRRLRLPRRDDGRAEVKVVLVDRRTRLPSSPRLGHSEHESSTLGRLISYYRSRCIELPNTFVHSRFPEN